MRFPLGFFIFIFSVCTSFHYVEAETTAINYSKDVRQAITDFNNHRQKLINSQNFFHEAIAFYHTRIHDKAVFEVAINDQRSHVPPQSKRLNKTQFIQQFLDDGQRLRSYQQDYSIVSVEANNSLPNAFTVKEKIFEQGMIPSFQMGDNSVTSFTTLSFCTSIYQVDGSSVIQAGSSCQTIVDFPEDI